jgi:hypothetical protein
MNQILHLSLSVMNISLSYFITIKPNILDVMNSCNNPNQCSDARPGNNHVSYYKVNNTMTPQPHNIAVITVLLHETHHIRRLISDTLLIPLLYCEHE